MAKLAAEHGIPFLAFRAVSDGGGDPLVASAIIGFPVQFLIYQQLAADNAADVAIEFLDRWSPAQLSVSPAQAVVRFGKQQQFTAPRSRVRRAPASCGACRSPAAARSTRTASTPRRSSRPLIRTVHVVATSAADGSVAGRRDGEPARERRHTETPRARPSSDTVRRVSLSETSALALSRPTAPSLRGVERLRPTGLPQLLRARARAGRRGRRARGGPRRARSSRASARAARREAAQRRAVRIAVRALGRLKGPFAKLGQFGAVRLDVLPAEVTDELKTLRDRVPPLPFERIRAVVESELGAPLERAFAAFDREPLGAASIAQAHRARAAERRAGRGEGAVPVARGVARDRSADRALAGAAGAARAARAAAPTRCSASSATGVREELDFEREARVAAEIAANLAGDASVLVPEVIASHSTRRVLTMRHHPAVAIDDRAGLARLGVAPRAVLAILARAYCAQVFDDGLFHADPHPGNLFVVDEPGAAERPRLLVRRLRPVAPARSRAAPRAAARHPRAAPADLPAFLDGMERLGAIAPGIARTSRARSARCSSA